ncbi:hypothetical protein D9M71_371550 [compost metagenome]
MRFEPRQAAKVHAADLQEVTEPGVWEGTYFKAPGATELEGSHYIRDRGKYFGVIKDPHNDGLRLVDARWPVSAYKLPIRRNAGGRWIYNNAGLRGGGHAQDLGHIDDLAQAFPGHGEPPSMARGAFQGEAVVASYTQNGPENYLFSINAQSCVVVSLYNPANRAGAVIHFDHNIRHLIEGVVTDVLGRLQINPNTQGVRAIMAGGDWLTGADIGGPVRQVLRGKGVQPAWDHWSYSSCFGNNFGLALDLDTGVTRIFKHSMDLMGRSYDDVLKNATRARDSNRLLEPLDTRAVSFMSRTRTKPLKDNGNGVVTDLEGRRVTDEAIGDQAFSLIAL